MKLSLESRTPTVAEYQTLLASVGWKPREPAAIERALANSDFAVCALENGSVVGMGRVIGDGGLHYFLSDIVVRSDRQRRGVGTRIVRHLAERLEEIPFKNTFVGVFAATGSRKFYERLGYKAQSERGPAMYRWLNGGAAQ